MARDDVDALLDRWLAAGVIDGVTAAAIRDFERERPAVQRLRWPAVVAGALGGILVGAGVLLFVAAHWDGLAPHERFALVVAMVAGFHVAGALAVASGALATTLHAVGTVTLGAGIALTGQIFHLDAHWPTGVLLWAAGAAFGWLVLLDWPQAALAAVLVPAWLSAEWVGRSWFAGGRVDQAVLAGGLLLAAFAYLAAERPAARRPVRRALAWVGALALLPCALALASIDGGAPGWVPPDGRTGRYVVGWIVAFAGPVLAAGVLGGMTGTMVLAVAAVWVLIGPAGPLAIVHWTGAWPYLWWGISTLVLIAWGIREASPRRVNLGFAGFALTVLGFYSSTVMDRLGRAVSLVGLGALFLVGGWLLDRLRRRVVARVQEVA
ncbi:MAG: DUF2157 domain-containing protein [Candidatus Binatia bacterium]